MTRDEHSGRTKHGGTLTRHPVSDHDGDALSRPITKRTHPSGATYYSRPVPNFPSETRARRWPSIARSLALAWHVLWPPGIVLALALACFALAFCSSGCTPSTQRAACSAVGATLNGVSDVLIDRMATDLAAAEGPDEVAAVEDRWDAVLSCYGGASVAQNAWADALDAGTVYPVESVRAAYCSARTCIASEVAMPDWPIGGCER